METNSSGEDLLFKARKPYTITKQRERWTEDEHNKFLEALKLYGRAWQRIEEHVGTKTAVQIRSHAQKFFTKLEKEAVNKGGNEIDIPPPRPKRKPSCPYPRKSKGISVNFHPLTVDFSKPKLLPPSSSSLFSCRDETACTDHDAPREKKMTSEKQHANEVSESGACSEILTLFKDVPCASNSSVSRTSPVKLETIAKEKKNKSPLEDQTLKESTETPKEKEFNTEPNPKPIKDADNLIGSNPIEIQQPVHTNYPPFLHNYPQFSPYLPNCHCNNDNNNTSSVFLNLLISNLVQNPAVLAAARLAASYWTPPVENETNAMDPASLAAIATATVAAASSWWAAQGLLPLYPTFPFMASPQSQMNLGEQNNHDKEDNSGVVNDPSKENGSCSNENMTTEKNDIIHINVVNKVNEQVDTNNNNNNNVKKKTDPSSCGSNTPSCSDVETDNILENLQNEPSCDNENFEGSFDNGKRGGRSSKEVSEEGRLAFQALFKRHILPQSFSPPHLKKNGEEREEMRDGTSVVELAVDLNKNADVIYPFTLAQGVDLYARLKGRRMGFKPYKRCSAEVKENRGTAGEETPCNKRIRLESETAQ